MDNEREALKALVEAVKRLSQVKDGKTLFEGSPTKDPEVASAWLALNQAMKRAQGFFRE